MPGCDPELNAAYVEGRLRGAEREQLEAHLAECADCRRLVTEWMAEETPPAVPRRAGWSWRWAVPALAGIVAVGSLVVYYRPHQEEMHKVAVQELPAQPPAAAPSQPAKAPTPTREAPPRVARVKGAEGASDKPVERREAVVEDRARLVAEAPAAAAVETAKVGVLRQEAAPAPPLPDGAPLRGVIRRGARVWAVSDSGRIFRSSDAGASWEKLESPTTVDLVAIRFDDREEMLVVEDREGRTYRVKP